MSAYFATHAGLLRYVAQDFQDMAQSGGTSSGDSDQAARLRVYASILERMVSELMPTSTPPQPGR